jgi:hypothetical protein
MAHRPNGKMVILEQSEQFWTELAPPPSLVWAARTLQSLRQSANDALGLRQLGFVPHDGGELPMNYFSYATDMNIKRFQNLLETSVDETERRMIESLITEEKAKAALQASEPKKE